ncbi:MAG TPA: hypothetical protein VHZ51_21825 [Ktedonobacteraceae bacterium]|nr:hypothetical protein [Ktedonobacteraceae bacterium]
MQTLIRPSTPNPGFRPPRPRRRRFSPFMLVGAAVTLLMVVGAGFYLFTQNRTGTHAANVNPNCTLIVPPNPLSAQGLATPYRLFGANDGMGPCNQANAMQTAFVQGAVLDPATGQISVYNPLVTDGNKQPAVTPTAPKLPANAVVGLWFGFQGTKLTLRGAQNSLNAGNCVNGLRGSVFGQFAYCNAPAFFQAANQAIAAGKLKVPALGTAKDGMTCPTTRDFSVVDQDQSDNTTTAYLLNGRGQTAQATAANMAQIPNAFTLTNASDNGLLDAFIDPALGCTPWTAPDLANPGHMVPALPLDELQAAANQAAPVALVPANDPMVLVNNNQNLTKVNAYRAGSNQTPAASFQQANGFQYCSNLMAIGPSRIFKDSQMTQNFTSPMPAMANSLFTFLATRFNMSLMNLKCNMRSPIRLQTNGNGVTINAFWRNTSNNNGGTTTNNNGTTPTNNNGGTTTNGNTTNNNAGTTPTAPANNAGKTPTAPATNNGSTTPATPTNNGGTTPTAPAATNNSSATPTTPTTPATNGNTQGQTPTTTNSYNAGSQPASTAPVSNTNSVQTAQGLSMDMVQLVTQVYMPQ